MKISLSKDRRHSSVQNAILAVSGTSATISSSAASAAFTSGSFNNNNNSWLSEGVDIVKAGSLHIKRPPTANNVKIRIKVSDVRNILEASPIKVFP